jgi:cardiolipin synthase
VATDGNRLALLRNGSEYFPSLVAAIDAARGEIYLETYIFADDVAGRRVARALLAAAARGVRTRVIVDGMGVKRYSGDLSEQLAAGNVSVLIYRPDISPFDFSAARLRRLHRKLAVIDGRVAFVGGINIIDDMNTPGQTPPRIDFAVRIEGPLAREVREESDSLWRMVALANLQHLWSESPALEDTHRTAGYQSARLLVRDNFRHRSDIEDAYLEAIERADEEIIIACAYFFPGRGFRRALAAAAARGVHVKLLLQQRVEYTLLHYASRALYGSLLDDGVHIYEYSKSFLHAKVAVIDAVWATVGSSNIDPFSLLLAREANIVAQDRRFAHDLRECLQRMIYDGAVPIAKRRWYKTALGQRLRVWTAYGIARLLIGVFGYGGRPY